MSALRRSDECVSDLAFDEWLGGGLEPASRREVEAHIEHCVRCSLRREVLAAQRAAFLERVPSWDALASAVDTDRRTTGAKPSRFLRPLVWGAGAALAASVALLFVLPHPVPSTSVRIKGGPHIGAFVKRGTRVSRAESGDSVQPGDYVSFTYSSDAPIYFALLNLDARKAILYYPLGAQTARVSPGSDVPLDFSIQLDDAPGSERVYGLFCEQPQVLEPLRAELEATGRLPALEHCRVDVLILAKEKGK